jgi:hypothetical protein
MSWKGFGRKWSSPDCGTILTLAWSEWRKPRNTLVKTGFSFLFSCGSTAQFWALAAYMKLSVSFRLLDLGQSAGLLGRVISPSQGLCVSDPGDCED